MLISALLYSAFCATWQGPATKDVLAFLKPCTIAESHASEGERNVRRLTLRRQALRPKHTIDVYGPTEDPLVASFRDGLVVVEGQPTIPIPTLPYLRKPIGIPVPINGR